MRFSGIVDLFHAHAFALGLAYGGVAFLVAAAIGVVNRRLLDLAALLCVAAAWLAVRGAWGPELASYRVGAALAVLTAGGAAARLIPRRVRKARDHPMLVTAVGLMPGAVMLAVLTPLVGGWVSRSGFAVSTILIGMLVRDFDTEKGKRGAPWLLYAVSAAGVYFAVPDTELARVMLGAALPFALLSVPNPMCRIGPAGTAALTGLFTWVVFVGGRGRPGSVVGGLATIGILAAEPVGRLVFGQVMSTKVRTRRADADWLLFAAVVALAQAVCAGYASRVVARPDSAMTALLVFLPAAVIAVMGAPRLFPDSPPVYGKLTRPPRRSQGSRSRELHHRPPGVHGRGGAPRGR